MRTLRTLKGLRIAILAADGFEKIELTAPMRAFQLAGARVEVVSLRLGRIRGVNLHEPAGRVRVMRTVDEVTPADYDGLMIPGGFINPDMLRQSASARALVRAFDAAGKPIATLCHGPWVLASAGLLAGRTLTSWPGIRDDLVNAGATWLDQPVVRDRNLVTSRGPQDLVPFIQEAAQLFAGTLQHPDDRAPASAPPRDHAPRAMIGAMRWLPRPSFRTAALLGGAALGAFALTRRSPRAADTMNRAADRATRLAERVRGTPDADVK